MNKRLFLLLYGVGEKNSAMRKLSVMGTRLSYYIFLAVFAVFFIVLFIKRADNINVLFFSLLRYLCVPLAALLLNTSLRRLFKRERPFKDLGTQSLIGDKKTYSFPSNHAASAMVIALASVYASGGFGIINGVIVFLALLTGLSRIMTGVHYPADVLGGYFVGGIIGYAGFFMF